MIVTTSRQNGEFAESSAEPRRKFRGEFAERPVCDFGVRTTLVIRLISFVIRMSVAELLANVQCPPAGLCREFRGEFAERPVELCREALVARVSGQHMGIRQGIRVSNQEFRGEFATDPRRRVQPRSSTESLPLIHAFRPLTTDY